MSGAVDQHQQRRPVIGIVGGIGSGKSFIAKLFGELGACVINSDDAVHRVYLRDDVKRQLRDWWGDGVFDAGGAVDRRAVAKIVFADPSARKRLEALIHPLVHEDREAIMRAAESDPAVTAYVWDTPLLIETNLHTRCDAVVFVDAPPEVRVRRTALRGWNEAELARREISQMPLDNKRAISDYIISNTADAEAARKQVRQVFSRIQASSNRPTDRS